MKTIFSHESDSTMAAYFRYGVEVGLIAPECARDWAFSVIAERGEPAIEIIEIATAGRRRDLLDALGAAMHGADQHRAAAMLLCHIHQELEQDRLSLRAAIGMSIQVVNATLPDSRLWYELDGIDDGLALAESGVWGTVDDVRSRLLRALKSHAL